MTDWAWHVHHNVLLEPLKDRIEQRIAYIRANKDPKELETRLRLLKPVQGPLPAAFVKAREAYDKAGEAYDKAWEAYVKAWEAYVKARKAYVKAREAYDNARMAGAFLALHAKECPDCPWNGETIFP